uniref:Adhesion G-protein coupled receptor G6 n=1 Tax=Myripristis murdjan TaxID=586833 RepID=A0A667Y8D9_9TELE
FLTLFLLTSLSPKLYNPTSVSLMLLSYKTSLLGCGSTNCNLVLTEAQGDFTSPCYPQDYPKSQSCKWTMQAPAGFIVQLSFLDFELEEALGCIYDRVVVNTGNTDAKFCGLTANGLTLNSTGNVMELSFMSDFSVQKRGFSVSFRHVAVALRNQKVTITGNNGKVTKVAGSVSIPTLRHLTVCFEVARSSQKQKEQIFTYSDDDDTALSFGSTRSSMELEVDEQVCSLDSIITASDLTSSMKPLCVTWTASTGRVAVYFNGNYRAKTCSSTSGRSVPSGGEFRLGGERSGGDLNFDGAIYNFRMWDYAMTVQQLAALTCDTTGNIIDWDNSYWDIPSSLAQTDSMLSCSEYPEAESLCGGLHEQFGQGSLGSCCILCRLPSCAVSSCPSSYTCQALLVYPYTTNESLDEAAVSYFFSFFFSLLTENCPEETPLHYHWPETRPNITQYLPCFPNKEQRTSRTCNELSNDEVSKVVTKVKELVNVAKINTTLASTVVTIISNVMTSSETALAAASEKALKTVDELVQKIEFEGPSVSITSRHLALGISALNTSMFNGTSFSAFIPPNTTDLEIDFKSERDNHLAQVTLPATLLSNLTLTEADRSTVSRINFMFFSKTNLFQNEQGGLSLNSYVVASSVGNYSISNLLDPVKIEIAHLSYQPSPNPVCMFWDFNMKNGTGGWNREGCRVAPESNSNKTICLCDHLTHFGILMDISGAAAQVDGRNTKILTFITYIGCGISAIFSAATLLTYIAFEKLRRDYPSKILMNLSTSLLFLNMVFLLDGWLASLGTDWLCVSVAIFLHYFLLTSFTWMGLESIHMYIALVKVFNTYIRRYILKFCIVGWGLPALLVGIVVAVDKNSYGKQQYGAAQPGQESSEFCWIRSPVVFYTTCVGYFCLVFLMNIAMFIVVMLQICGRNGKRSNRTLREEVLRNLRSVISLTFLLGMTWGFALFAWGPVNLAFMYLFTIFNSLQGLFIFVFHCALKENVQKQWRRYLCCGRFRLADNSDWSKTATNNTKKVSSDNLGKSLSSSSFGSSTANWTSKAKTKTDSTLPGCPRLLNQAHHDTKLTSAEFILNSRLS